jgi:hypothetical protein
MQKAEQKRSEVHAAFVAAGGPGILTLVDYVAPLSISSAGAAKQALDREDRSETIANEGKGT